VQPPRPPSADTLGVPLWPPLGASARSEAFERHRPARIAGDGVLFGLWCDARHVVAFVTGEALCALAGRALDQTQWLASYKANVRKIHSAARAEAAFRCETAEPLVVATSSFAAA
jgi:hypothetical protein